MMLRKLLGLLRSRKIKPHSPAKLHSSMPTHHIDVAPLSALLDRQPGARAGLRALALVERTISLSHKGANPLPLLQAAVLKRAIAQLSRLQSALDDDVGLLLYQMRKQDAENDKMPPQVSEQAIGKPIIDLSEGDLRFQILSHIDFADTRPFPELPTCQRIKHIQR